MDIVTVVSNFTALHPFLVAGIALAMGIVLSGLLTAPWR